MNFNYWVIRIEKLEKELKVFKKALKKWELKNKQIRIAKGGRK